MADFETIYEEGSESKSSDHNKPSPKKLKFPPPDNSMDRNVTKSLAKDATNNPIQNQLRPTLLQKSR